MADMSVLRWMREHPAQVGRWCGFDRLTDELHGKWMRDMITGADDMTLLAHRGSYKTTCLSVALSILTATEPARNLIFMRKSEDAVKEIIGQVRKIILSEPYRYLTAKAFGEEYGPVMLRSASSTAITTDVYATAKGAAQLLGIGTSGAITGKHADVVVTDDIVTIDDRVSKAERDRIVRVYQELQNIRNPGGRIINTGTPWHPEDAIAKCMPNVQRSTATRPGFLPLTSWPNSGAACRPRSLRQTTSCSTSPPRTPCSRRLRARRTTRPTYGTASRMWTPPTRARTTPPSPAGA